MIRGLLLKSGIMQLNKIPRVYNGHKILVVNRLLNIDI